MTPSAVSVVVRSARTATMSAWQSTGLAVVLTLVIPAGLIETAGGGPVRTLYPAYMLVAGLWLAGRHRTSYPAFIVASFAFSPFLRRLADYGAGFSVFNLILLAPYLAMLPALPALMRTMGDRASPLRWPVMAITACVAYAGLLSLVQGVVVPTAYEGLRWLMPTALCCFVLDRPGLADQTGRRLTAALCAIVPILAGYGVYQYFAAPPWDVFWMWNIDNPTFGEPVPYRIRVFSMMNSPGSVGVFVSYAMVLLAGESGAALLVGAAGLPLLALTVIRTAWLSLAVGLVVVLLRASPGRRMGLLAGSLAIGMAGAAAFESRALPPEVRNLIDDRLATFTSLSNDASTYDRLRVYDAFYDRLAERPWGEGFGANESTTTKQQTHRSTAPIDSGVLETYLIYGVFGGTLYLLGFLSVLGAAWRAVGSLGGRMAGHFGAGCAALVILPLGIDQVGESGVLLWAALGVLIACAEARRAGAPGFAKDRPMPRSQAWIGRSTAS